MAAPFPTVKNSSKCTTYCQPGHRGKMCPTGDKHPKSTCCKCRQLGHWAALCPEDQRTPPAGFQLVARAEEPPPPPVGPITRNFHHWTGAEGANGLAGGTIPFLPERGAIHSVLTFFPGPFSSRTYPVWGVPGKPTSPSFTLPLCCL